MPLNSPWEGVRNVAFLWKSMGKVYRPCIIVSCCFIYSKYSNPATSHFLIRLCWLKGFIHPLQELMQSCYSLAISGVNSLWSQDIPLIYTTDIRLSLDNHAVSRLQYPALSNPKIFARTHAYFLCTISIASNEDWCVHMTLSCLWGQQTWRAMCVWSYTNYSC